MKTWRCFHCGEVFRSADRAAVHFGGSENATPACSLTRSLESLVELIRIQERELAGYRGEDDKVLRAMLARESVHAAELRAGKEDGYNRGVADMAAIVKELFLWGSKCQELFPEGLAERITAILGPVETWGKS